MEIHKYLRTDRPDASGRYQVRLVLHANNLRLQLSTGEKVSDKGWDSKRERAKGTEPYYLLINNRLDNLETILQFVYQHAAARSKEALKAGFEAVRKCVEVSGEKEISEKLLKSAWEEYINPKAPAAPADQEPASQAQTANFFQLMDLWVADEKRRVNMKTGRKRSPNTIKSFQASINKFNAFQIDRKKTLTLNGMTSAFYKEFQDYMLEEKKHEINYFGKVVGHLTQFLGWCEKEHDLEVHRHYRNFETPSIYIGVDFLLLDEFLSIKNLNFKSEDIRKKLDAGYSNKLREDLRAQAFEAYVSSVELARDIFLMCCYTGLRISDCQNFSKSWIVGELIIVENTIKTAGTAYIPYFDDDIFEPVAMVEKYAGQEDRIFPKCPKINEYLKLIQKLAKVTRFELSTKIGRKTFVTMKTYQGVPARLIMQATTHQSEKDFNRYLGVDTKELVQAFRSKSVNASGAKTGAEKASLAIPA